MYIYTYRERKREAPGGSVYIRIHGSIHTCMYACIYVYVRASVDTCMHGCMYVCVHTCIRRRRLREEPEAKLY